MNYTLFKDYCESISNNPKLGSKIFFQDQNNIYSYQQLMDSAHSSAHGFLNSPEDFFALKVQSPFKLFAFIVGAILAQKKVLIISNQEPANSIRRLQERIPFTSIINDLEPYIHNSGPLPKIELDSERPAFYILSSGSSGPPKAIALSLDNVFHSSKSIIDFFNMTSGDISFSNLPLHHIGGLMIFWRAFFSLGKVTALESDSYQFISLVPLQLKRMITDESKTLKLAACRGVLIGGAPLNTELLTLARKKNIPIFETYGMSETCSLVMLNGKSLAGQQVKLDPNGYFLIKGKTLSANAPVDVDGFYHTKDVGRENLDGTLSFLHRGDLLFKSAGEMINPLEIEALAKELSYIREAVVVPIKHNEWTWAQAMVFQSLDPSKNHKDLKEYFQKNVHPHLVPKYFIEAPIGLMSDGIKPARFEISKFAQQFYFKELFNHLYFPNPNSKRLLVYLHGFMEDHSDLIALMDENADASCLFIDLPGHGKTKISHFKDRASAFWELKSLIEFYNTGSELILYGYSMGGRIAIELTLMGICPTVLILESAHFGLHSNAEKEARLNLDLNLFSRSGHDLSVFFKEWYENPIFTDYNKSSHYKSDIEKKLLHPVSEWLGALKYFSPGTFPFEQQEVQMKLTSQKIIGIVGSEDTKYKKHFEEMNSLLLDFNLYVIEHCGHNPHKTHLSRIKRILNLLSS